MITFKQAIKEMRKGKFIRQKDTIKGLYYFTENKKLIGDNPNERIYAINIGDSKFIDLNKVNLNYSGSGFLFLGDFKNNWISKNLRIKDKDLTIQSPTTK
jgi:hypothetical protein